MSYQITSFKGVMCVKNNPEFDKNSELLQSDTDKVPAKRGKIKGLSRKSRKNLLRIINKLEPSESYYFVTLTYGRNWIDEPKLWKRHLSILLKRVRANYPKSSGLWRLEFQKRKAPHYHILFHIPEKPNSLTFKKILQKSWLNQIEDHSYGAQRYSIQCDFVGSQFKDCALYSALYQAKDANDRKDIATGKLWGTFNKTRLPVRSYGFEECSRRRQTILRRICRKWMQAHSKTHGYTKWLKARDGSFDLFIPLHEQKRLIQFVKNYKFAQAIKKGDQSPFDLVA